MVKFSTDFQIVRLTERDASDTSDHLLTLKDLLLQNEGMYPGIGKWVKGKVIPGLASSERVAFVGYLKGKPVASAVVKKGEAAKFCHLRISDAIQDANIGELFFTLMAYEVADSASSIHFTLPETLWGRKSAFFQSFGFSAISPSDRQYRLWDRELNSSASFRTVWSAVLRKVPKVTDLCQDDYDENRSLLMSIQPRFASQILSGKKRYEIRRKFSTKWIGHRVNIYATAPLMSLVGEARIAGVTQNSPENIWTQFSEHIGCNKDQFDAYVGNMSEVFAIELDNIVPYIKPVPAKSISNYLAERLLPPQSYCTLEKGTPWAQAVSITTYIQEYFNRNVVCSMKAGLSSWFVTDSPNRDRLNRLSQTEFRFPSLSISSESK